MRDTQKKILLHGSAISFVAAALISCGAGGSGGVATPSTIATSNSAGSYFSYKDAKNATGAISISAAVLPPNTTKSVAFLNFEAVGCQITTQTGLPAGEQDMSTAISLPFALTFAAPCNATQITVNAKETIYLKSSNDANATSVPISSKLVSYTVANSGGVSSIIPNQNYAIKLIAQPTTFLGSGGNYTFVVSATKNGNPVQSESLRFYELSSNDTNITNGNSTFNNGVSAPVIVTVKPNSTSAAGSSTGPAKQFSFAIVVGSEIQTVTVTQPVNDQSDANPNPVFIILPSLDSTATTTTDKSLTIDSNTTSLNLFIKLSKNDALKDGTFLLNRLIPAPNSSINWGFSSPNISTSTSLGQSTSDANGNITLALSIKPNTSRSSINFDLYLYNNNSFRTIHIAQNAPLAAPSSSSSTTTSSTSSSSSSGSSSSSSTSNSTSSTSTSSTSSTSSSSSGGVPPSSSNSPGETPPSPPSF